MEIFDRLVGRASVGKLPEAKKLPQSGVAQRLAKAVQRITQPSAVLRILIYKNGELVHQDNFDPNLQRFFKDDAIGESVVRSVSEFMADSFRVEGNEISFVCASTRVIGLFEGPYTLVALVKADANENFVQMWLRQVLKTRSAELEQA